LKVKLIGVKMTSIPEPKTIKELKKLLTETMPIENPFITKEEIELEVKRLAKLWGVKEDSEAK
tara:strand:+ start:438 stop:626 length:189 start_codon:yes stop_codon:yes gene_type:complete